MHTLFLDIQRPSNLAGRWFMTIHAAHARSIWKWQDNTCRLHVVHVPQIRSPAVKVFQDDEGVSSSLRSRDPQLGVSLSTKHRTWHVETRWTAESIYLKVGLGHDPGVDTESEFCFSALNLRFVDQVTLDLRKKKRNSFQNTGETCAHLQQEISEAGCWERRSGIWSRRCWFSGLSWSKASGSLRLGWPLGFCWRRRLEKDARKSWPQRYRCGFLCFLFTWFWFDICLWFGVGATPVELELALAFWLDPQTKQKQLPLVNPKRNTHVIFDNQFITNMIYWDRCKADMSSRNKNVCNSFESIRWSKWFDPLGLLKGALSSVDPKPAFVQQFLGSFCWVTGYLCVHFRWQCTKLI